MKVCALNECNNVVTSTSPNARYCKPRHRKLASERRHEEDKPARNYGTGRRCDECGNPVSRYTPDDYGTLCNAHRGLVAV